MRRLATGSALALLQHQQHRGGFNAHKPKTDVELGSFDHNKEYLNFLAQNGRVVEHDAQRLRKVYFRLDELWRRGEAAFKKEGFFYMPTLDFPIYRGLTPLFSARQLYLHYDKHHRAYVERLNKLIIGTRFYGKHLDELIISTHNDAEHAAIYNNAAQHFNHSFFWKGLAPNGSQIPPDLERALVAQYGSLQEFEKTFINAALGHFGSGWVYWVWDTSVLKFDIISLGNADTPLTTPHVKPLLACDVWEHAYYQDYENDRAKYMSRFFACVDYHWAERHWKRATGQEYHEVRYQ